MTGFEIFYLLVEPFLLPLHREMRRRIKAAVDLLGGRAVLLDVGGRKSHYTIGIGADVVVSDLPRRSEIQKALSLGMERGLIHQTLDRRSNIIGYVFNDMTESCYQTASVDLVVAVEVLEHVDEDDRFVAEVARVLRDGGIFLMSTPNGDHLTKVTNPDHRRHYRKSELEKLLRRYFREVQVDYAIVGGKARMMGLKSWSLRHPLRTLSSMTGNVINGLLSRNPALAKRAKGTQHLIGRGVK